MDDDTFAAALLALSPEQLIAYCALLEVHLWPEHGRVRYQARETWHAPTLRAVLDERATELGMALAASRL